MKTARHLHIKRPICSTIAATSSSISFKSRQQQSRHGCSAAGISRHMLGAPTGSTLACTATVTRSFDAAVRRRRDLDERRLRGPANKARPPPRSRSNTPCNRPTRDEKSVSKTAKSGASRATLFWIGLGVGVAALGATLAYRLAADRCRATARGPDDAAHSRADRRSELAAQGA